MTQTELETPSISFFRKPASSTHPHSTVSIRQVYLGIRDGRFREETESLRVITDLDERREYKKNEFNFVTFSGTFSYRNSVSLVKHSGLICLDLDHLAGRRWELRDRLIVDPYFETELLFTSPSGDGLKWVVEIDLSRATHLDWFKSIRNYVRVTYGVAVDESCKDVVRACYLPHDPEIYINPIIDVEINNSI